MNITTCLPQLFCAAALLSLTALHAQGLVCELESAEATPADAAAFDRFASALSVDGDWAVIGAPDDDDSGTASGSIYVYERVLDDWLFHTKLQSSDSSAFDQFGASVSISGTIIAAGSPGEDTVTLNATGAAYVFRLTAGVWSQEAKLTASDDFPDDRFGQTIATSGNRVLVGAPDEFFQAGSAYTFTFDGSAWSQEQKLDPFPHLGQARFAESVALNGNTAVIGSPFGDDGVITSGNAFAFEFSGSSWSQTGILLASDRQADDLFGTSINFSQSTNLIVVGAPGHDAAGNNAGAAYVFRKQAGTWIESAKLLANDAQPDDSFGLSVAAAGNVVVVGAPGRDDGPTLGAGGAYCYLSDGVGLPFRLSFTSTAPTTDAEFGACVAASLDRILIGAPNGGTTPANSGLFASRKISGSWDVYGTGLAGTGGMVPLLGSTSVCPQIGDTPVLVIANGLGGAPGLLLLAAGRGDIPFRGGSLLLVPNVFGQIPHTLSGMPGVAGAGTFSISLAPTTPGLFGLAAHAQAGYLDAGAPQLVSLTNGMRLTIP